MQECFNKHGLSVSSVWNLSDCCSVYHSDQTESHGKHQLCHKKTVKKACRKARQTDKLSLHISTSKTVISKNDTGLTFLDSLTL